MRDAKKMKLFESIFGSILENTARLSRQDANDLIGLIMYMKYIYMKYMYMKNMYMKYMYMKYMYMNNTGKMKNIFTDWGACPTLAAGLRPTKQIRRARLCPRICKLTDPGNSSAARVFIGLEQRSEED
jgi:hypothetical protein